MSGNLKDLKLSKHYGGLTMEQWLPWIGSTVIAALLMSAYVHQNFSNKDSQKEFRAIIERRLDRIETKLDSYFFEKIKGK